MITVTWYDTEFTSDKAVRGYDYVALYDENNHETQRIYSIHGEAWDHVSISGGEWFLPEDVPTNEEMLRADIDFLEMENEYLQNRSEQDRADIDYCLMLLEG